MYLSSSLSGKEQIGWCSLVEYLTEAELLAQ